MIENEILKILKSIMFDGLEKFGKYYSLYRGFVYDNKDPLGCSRIQILLPSIYGITPYDYWASPSNVYSGKGYGSQVLPQIGDLVWIEFEMGNPKKPIWKFGYFGVDEKPEKLKDVGNFWFKTPKGHLIEFDDSKELITITSSKGKVIEISDTIDLGGQKDKEPVLLGNKSYTLIQKLLEGLEQATTSTMLGPQPLINKAYFTNLRTELLPKIKSETVNVIP